MNTILVIYTFQFFLDVFLCRKSEKNENFDLPYEHKLPNSLLLSQNKTHDLLSE